MIVERGQGRWRFPCCHGDGAWHGDPGSTTCTSRPPPWSLSLLDFLLLYSPLPTQLVYSDYQINRASQAAVPGELCHKTLVTQPIRIDLASSLGSDWSTDWTVWIGIAGANWRSVIWLEGCWNRGEISVGITNVEQRALHITVSHPALRRIRSNVILLFGWVSTLLCCCWVGYFSLPLSYLLDSLFFLTIPVGWFKLHYYPLDCF